MVVKNDTSEIELGDMTDVDMKVYPTHDCINDCSFCMTDLRWKNSEAGTEEYLNNFERAFKAYHEAGGRKVLFTGGEPTTKPKKLIGMLKIIKDFPLELVTLYTNGLYLLKKHDGNTFLPDFGYGKPLIESLNSEGLEKINLTVNHYDYGEIDCERRHEFGLYTKCLNMEGILQKTKELEMEIRLNCVLLKDYIGNPEEIENYLECAKNAGITDVYFRDLFHLENRDNSCRFSDERKLQYTDEQRVDFNKLVQGIRDLKDFEEIGQLERHRSHGKTYMFNYKDINVSFGTLKIGTEKENEITYFNFQPNGRVYRDMNGPESEIGGL